MIVLTGLGTPGGQLAGDFLGKQPGIEPRYALKRLHGDSHFRDQPLLIGSGFTPVDEFGPSSHWRRSLEMSEAVSTNQASSQTSPVHMISSLNMASSSCMATSGPLSSPQNDVDSRSELDSVEEQLSNLTVCNSKNPKTPAENTELGDTVNPAGSAAKQPGLATRAVFVKGQLDPALRQLNMVA
ncbi:unnamed protein product [Toxocara canis]|uniref:Uncharacterized protein n=1 Tax=Toxocara canis TaxID=6265 RepID=A0A183U3X4_TOXCA|nr:unnamed protein product [Toxocara canis]